MAQLTITSKEEGDRSSATIRSNAKFQLPLEFDHLPGGSGAAEVKVSMIHMDEQSITVVRNIGDGTHFQVNLNFETSEPTIQLEITKANPSGSIEYRTANDVFLHTVESSPLTITLRV